MAGGCQVAASDVTKNARVSSQLGVSEAKLVGEVALKLSLDAFSCLTKAGEFLVSLMVRPQSSHQVKRVKRSPANAA